ncbi:hypothetical protein QNM97_20905 [Gordonia sp. L191]|uniref:hypothetical protein n=1 Tax=Gordonia sp. L191 TaxID=2982699 RepID=UPI0024BF67B8|nr:hypothetical protein [Gordonia sp. L191]WHU46424.1 hypothetical protein QNM97_20905 [Gordonia sp. L191]
MTNPRLLPILYGVGAVLSAVIVGPLFGGGYLLYRDAVSTPRSFVTDAALGIGPLAPRAVPQDWFVAVAGSVVGGGVVVLVALAAAVLFAAVGFGRLAFRLVPGAGRSGAVAAAVVTVWNPFVAERLLQGNWSLLVGYAALGWIVVAVADVAEGRARGRWVGWAQVGGLLAVAGLTPTGSVMAAVIAGVTAVSCTGIRRWRMFAGLGALWVCSALPWLMSAVIGSGSIASDGPAGVRAFSLRSEPLLGPLGTALGLGGIWNSDAVPTSRTIWWAAIATACLLVVIVAGSVWLWRSRSASPAPGLLRGVAALAAVVVLLVAVTAAGPGQAALGAVVDAVPGAGLVRDTQKFLALVMPFVALASAAAVVALRRYVPAGFALAAIALLVIAPLPDLAWGVGGRITPAHYPDDWTKAAAMVPADRGAVALWPPGTVRQYSFAEGPSLDPTTRMVRAPVIESGELRVDGVVVDHADHTAAQVNRVLRSGANPRALSDLGVGWVLVERGPQTSVPAELADLTPVVSGPDLMLFDLGGAVTPRASSMSRGWAWAGHVIWALLMVVGALAAVIERLVNVVQRQASRRTRSISSHVVDHE